MEPGQKPAVRFPSPFERPKTQTPTKFGCVTKDIQDPKVGASFLDFPRSQPEKATPRPTHVNLDKTAGWTSSFISRVDLRVAVPNATRASFPALLPNENFRVALLRQALAELAVLHWRLAIELWSSRVAVLALRSEGSLHGHGGHQTSEQELWLLWASFSFIYPFFCFPFFFSPSGSGARESVTVLGLKPFFKGTPRCESPFFGLVYRPAQPSPPPPTRGLHRWELLHGGGAAAVVLPLGMRDVSGGIWFIQLGEEAKAGW